MKTIIALIQILCLAIVLKAQQPAATGLPYKMEELTTPQFIRAVELSKGICVIPIGIIEKHGAHLPIGTDLIQARQMAFGAVKQEYAVVFPQYFTGQIFVAKAQPGTIAYSSELMWKMLDETCKELSRNGLKKIILLNGHGGNTDFLRFFCQSQLASQKDYIVVLFQSSIDPAYAQEIRSLKRAKLDGHAGEDETSMIYYINPDLVDESALKDESGLDQNKLGKMPSAYTGILWYSKYPNHFQGDYIQPNKRLGELLIKSGSNKLVELIRFLKSDNTIEQLQEEFYKKAQNPGQK